MSRNPFFCSDLSRAVGEKTFGTASTGEVWLLVEYPFAWASKALEGSNLSPPIKSHLADSLKAVPRSRLLFIKQGPLCGERVAAFVVRCREREPFVVRLDLGDYRELLDLDLAQVAAGNLPAGAELSREPLYLVCTHGRRDKCCAKYGMALFKSLHALHGDAVWQSSHVGGDRFAANLVCFPHGLFYAHVTEDEGRRAVGEYGAGRLVLEKYRGRACYRHVVQAAEFFARAESGLVGLRDLRAWGCEPAGEDRWRVRFLAPRDGRAFDVTLSRRLSEFRNFVTCQSEEERRVPQFQLEEFKETAYRRQGV